MDIKLRASATCRRKNLYLEPFEVTNVVLGSMLHPGKMWDTNYALLDQNKPVGYRRRHIISSIKYALWTNQIFYFRCFQLDC